MDVSGGDTTESLRWAGEGDQALGTLLRSGAHPRDTALPRSEADAGDLEVLLG